jgi:hypothetical protein
MSKIEDLVFLMQKQHKGIKFKDLVKVCDHFFGQPRQNGTSHMIYKTPWQGDPRINIQKSGKEAKPYQVRQVLSAINKKNGML